MNLANAVLRSSPRPFDHKQMIDRVLAASARLHSPSHYDQLALFSLFPAIGERCGLISGLLDFHNKRGAKGEKQSGTEQQRLIDTFSNHTAAAMFSVIFPTPGKIKPQPRLFMIRHQIKSGILPHISHCVVIVLFCRLSLNGLRYDSQGLSALVYNPDQSKTIFKTHCEKLKRARCFEALKTCLYLFNGALSRGELYHK